MEKLFIILKSHWYILFGLVIILALFLVPSRSGLPDKDYQGCDIKGSYCQYSEVKTITKESNGSATLTVPVKINDDKDQDITFTLNKYNDGWVAGNRIFLNIVPNDHRMYLFIEHRSSLFVSVLNVVFSGSTGVTSVVDTSTGHEVEH